MTEGPPTGPEKAKEKNWEDMTPEEQTAFEADMLSDVEKRHPTIASGETSPEKLLECRREVARLEGLMVEFEVQHPLGALHAITDLNPFDPEDVAKYPIREGAKKWLVVIVGVLNKLEEEKIITSGELEELKQKYYVLSRAVGIVNNKKVDHTRML